MKKKIIFFHCGGGIGGAPISLIELVCSLNKEKFDPLIVFSEKGPIAEYSKEKGIRTLVIPLKSAFFYSAHAKIRLRMLLKFIFYFFSTIKNTRKLILSEKPDLVYLNTSVLVPVALAIKKYKIPIFWHIREVPGSNKFIKGIHLRIINMYSTRIIAVSDFVKSFFPNSNKVNTIYNSVNLKKFRSNNLTARKKIRAEFSIDQNSFIVCKIGNVQKEKGHFFLVEVAKKLIDKFPNIVFMIVSEITSDKYLSSWKGIVKSFLNMPLDNYDRMKSLVKQSGLQKNFIFTGNRQDIPDLLSASDLIVFLSQKEEGFGRPIIEGMAAGKPVISTALGPSYEIIGDEAWFDIPSIDANDFANAIYKLILDEKLRVKIGKAGIKRVSKYFNSSINNKIFLELINEILYEK